jgi:transglutaminase-like putative cysteine protease
MSLQLVPHMVSPVRRFVLVHTTGYHYDGTVVASFNEARMTPLTTPDQAVLDARVEVDPMTWSYTYWDYWGTQVTAFEALTPHTELTVVSSSTVDLYPGTLSPGEAGWDVLSRPDVRDTHQEFLVQSPHTEPVPEVVALARDAAGDLAPDAAARAVCDFLHSAIEYVPGVTSVHTSAEEVWQTRQGVCQDFAHLTLGALRALGIPARYVSGYLHPQPDAELGETVEGQSHAWVEWWAGEWVPFDSTHASAVGVDHVLVARGRDYTDVTPLKGIYAGAASSELFVTVEVTRLG